MTMKISSEQKTLGEWNAKIGDIFSYWGEGDALWKVIAETPSGGLDLEQLDGPVQPHGGPFISKNYPLRAGRFARVEGYSCRKVIGYIGIDDKGKPVRPVKSGDWSRKSYNLPPRIYTTPEKAKQYHGAVDAKPVYME